MTISITTTDNPNNTVTVVVTSTGSTATVYRGVGGVAPTAVSGALPLSGGTATYVDTPPQKTLLTYYATNDSNETSTSFTTVLPINYSLGRPCLNGDIVLGDMTFNTIDSDGTVWTISDIEGWWSLPTATIPTSDRAPYEDGDYDDNGRYESRTMKFEGAFLPASREMLETARARLVAALDLVRRTAQLKVYETVPKFMDVRISGTTLIDTTKQSGLTYFSTSLRASYPVKRSISSGSSTIAPLNTGIGRTYSRSYARVYPVSPAGNGSGVITNQGNYPTYPVITISGPLTNPRIENSRTGAFIELNIVLTSTDVLIVDMRQKSVMLNNQASRRGALTLDSTWWPIVPGDNELKFTAFLSGMGAMSTISAQSAWIG